MADEVLVEGKGLSQGERIVDTFLAPTKTFTDMLHNTSWWVPFAIGTVASYVLAFGIQSKVGWSQLVDNVIQASPKMQAQLASLTPPAIAAQHKGMLYSFQYGFYAAPFINIIFLLIIAVVLWPTINFAVGGKSTFGQVFCVANYAFLPATVKALVAAAILFAGAAPENFTVENMLGTSPGYFISTPGPMKTLLTAFDVFSLWTLVLMSIGLAIVARTKRRSGFAVVVGWWVFVIIFQTSIKALFG